MRFMISMKPITDIIALYMNQTTERNFLAQRKTISIGEYVNKEALNVIYLYGI